MKLCKKLANYRLVDGVKRLLVPKGEKAEIEEILTILQTAEPENNYVIEPFAVLKGAMSGGEVKEWKKMSGHSLWQVLA